MRHTVRMKSSHRLGLVAGLALVVPLMVSGCTSTPSPVGTWGAGGEAQPQLIISEDGAIGGTDGCNVMFGNWLSDGDGIVFKEVGGTLMFCEGVDTWLSQMQSATFQDNEIHIRGEGGEEIGTLAKQ